MAKKLVQDKLLLTIVLLMLGFGSVMVYSSSAVLSMDLYGNSYTFFVKHLVILVISLVLMIFVSSLEYKKVFTSSLIASFYLLSLTLLVGVLLLNPVNNTYRWIRFGMFSFQPSELAKLTLIIFTAYYLSKHSNRLEKSVLSMAPFFISILVIIALIIIEPDVGTGLTILFVILAMLFVAGFALRYYLIGSIGVSGVIYYLIISSNYRTSRVLAFIDPWADPLGYGFQPIQSILAIGSGGVVGAGLAKGTQKYFYLPTPHTDFIYSVIGEELGFIGSILLVLLFCMILWRGMRIAFRAPDVFGRLLATGITIMIVGQAFLNISVAQTLLPTKGIPLPLISFGGTAMLINLIGVGILLNISRYTS